MAASPDRFSDCYDLAEKLPYFGIMDDGRLHLKEMPGYPIIDSHTHLGMTYFLSGKVDLLGSQSEADHEFPTRGVPVIMAQYSGLNARLYLGKKWRSDAVKRGFFKKGAPETQTIPAMLDEMYRFGVSRSVVLPVDGPLGLRNTRNFLQHAGKSDNLIFFCNMAPLNLGWKKKLAGFVAAGAKGLKIHPYTEMCPPDHPRMIALLKEWQQYRLPVIYHTGFCGIEPPFTRKWLRIEGYERPLKEFPGIRFILGHAGSALYRKATALAKKYDNAYLEVSGQPSDRIRYMIDELGRKRVLFGTDWPYYPVILPLAKALIATEGDPAARKSVLYENAKELFGISV